MSTPVTELWQRHRAEMAAAADHADKAAAELRLQLGFDEARLSELANDETALTQQLADVRAKIKRTTAERDERARNLAKAEGDAEAARRLLAAIEAEGAEAVRLIATTTGPLSPETAPLTDPAQVRMDDLRMTRREALRELTREAVDAGTYGEPAPDPMDGPQGDPFHPAADPFDGTPRQPGGLGEPVAGQVTTRTRPEGVEPPPLGGFPAAEPSGGGVVDGSRAPGPDQDQGQDGGDR